MDIKSTRQANLLALINARFEGKQSALAEAIDRSSSYVNRCLMPFDKKGSKPIGEKFARHIEQTLEMEPYALDSETGIDTPARRSFLSIAEPASSYALAPVEAWDDETPLGEDEVELPFFKEVEMSAGKGSEVALEAHGRKLRFGRRTLQRKTSHPKLPPAPQLQETAWSQYYQTAQQ